MTLYYICACGHSGVLVIGSRKITIACHACDYPLRIGDVSFDPQRPQEVGP